jgi:hypothetical protein
MYANSLRVNTRVSDDGANVSASEFWAYPAAHEIFFTEIGIAQDILDGYDAVISSANTFAHGDSFDVVVRIDENPGFANVRTRLYIPNGLELTGFSHNDLPGLGNNIVSPAIPTSGSAYAVAGWTGRTSDIQGDIDLFTFTFTVADDATLGFTDPITIDFLDVPMNADGEEVQIFLPCGGEGTEPISVIGSVFIVETGSN